MQNYFQRETITATKKMIRAFFIRKNVEGALEFFSRERITFISIGEDEIFDSFDEVRDYFQRTINAVTSAYKIVSEDYSVKAASYDSCIVVAKIGFQADSTHAYYKFYVLFSFYFQLINDKLLVTFVQSHMPEKALEKEKLHVDVKWRKEFLFQFENVNYIAAKSFLCKDNLPYCYVNGLFLKLLGYKKIKLENYSSLAHIHPNDQQKYFNYMQKIFTEKNTGVSEGWRWHNSHCIMYRLVNCNREEIKVLEWGNLLSLNSNFIVNSFVTPLDELEFLDDIPNPPPRIPRLSGRFTK